jgi:hypothetical protein
MKTNGLPASDVSRLNAAVAVNLKEVAYGS